MSNEKWDYLEAEPSKDAPLSDNPSGLYCTACRESGVWHCAHPEWCGEMRRMRGSFNDTPGDKMPATRTQAKCPECGGMLDIDGDFKRFPNHYPGLSAIRPSEDFCKGSRQLILVTDVAQLRVLIPPDAEPPATENGVAKMTPEHARLFALMATVYVSLNRDQERRVDEIEAHLQALAESRLSLYDPRTHVCVERGELKEAKRFVDERGTGTVRLVIARFDRWLSTPESK